MCDNRISTSDIMLFLSWDEALGLLRELPREYDSGQAFRDQCSPNHAVLRRILSEIVYRYPNAIADGQLEYLSWLST